MEIPKYEAIFSKQPKVEKLSDSSFEKNAHTLLQGYYNFLPTLEAHLANIHKLSPLELLTYNEKVAQILYGPRILSLFKHNQHEKINELSEIEKERLLKGKKEIIKRIDFNNLAEILIRPEARFLTDEIKAFLHSNGYEIVIEKPILVDLKQYWVMYNEGFTMSHLADFPTRTLVYTQGESKILVLHKNQENLQQHLNSDLKGAAGIKSTKPTLRGTVILNGFEKAKNENTKLFYDSIDPLGMYRAITKGEVESPDQFSSRKDPVFYYAGQGIHLPETRELETNLGILLDEKNLEYLAKKFIKI